MDCFQGYFSLMDMLIQDLNYQDLQKMTYRPVFFLRSLGKERVLGSLRAESEQRVCKGRILFIRGFAREYLRESKK